MNINWTYIVLALAVFALWGLRRLGVDDTTADTITTFLMLGLGATPSALPKVAKKAGVALLVLFATGCATLAGAAVDTIDWRCPTLWQPHLYDDRTELVCESTGKRVVLWSDAAP